MSVAKRRRSRPSRADRRRTRQNRFGIAIIAGLAVTMVLGAIAVYAFKPPAREEQTGCVLGTPPPSLTTVLIDASDPLTPRQAADIRGKLEDLRERIPTNGRVEVYALGDKPDALLMPIVAACNPGDPEKVNVFFHSRRIAADQWHDLFAGPLDTAITSSLRSNPTNLSPILEAIQSVAIQSLARDEFKRVDKRLVIVSDFIQNTAGLDQYKEKIGFNQFSSTPYYHRVRSDLRDVSVTLLYVWRNTRSSIQGRSHAEFWSALLSDEGAHPVDVKSIQG